jgi:hypothetical protein
MWNLARRARRPLDRLRVLWERPGWRPPDLGGPVVPPEVDRATHAPYHVPLPRGLGLYVLVQFVAVNLGAIAFLYGSDRLGPAARSAGALAVVWSLTSLGGLLDRRSWAPWLETARLVALGVGLLLLPLPSSALAGGVGWAVLSAWALRRCDGREKPLPLEPGLR